MTNKNILIIGATRGLGASLANQYASQESTIVYGTTRQDTPPSDKLSKEIKWVKGIDVSQSKVGENLIKELKSLAGTDDEVLVFDVVVSLPKHVNGRIGIDIGRS